MLSSKYCIDILFSCRAFGSLDARVKQPLNYVGTHSSLVLLCETKTKVRPLHWSDCVWSCFSVRSLREGGGGRRNMYRMIPRGVTTGNVAFIAFSRSNANNN
jgi:hypothetical protein